VHDALVHELLDLVEEHFALLPVAFARLLRERVVDLRISAVGVRRAADDERLQARRRVAQRRRGRQDQRRGLLRAPDFEFISSSRARRG